MNTSGTWNNSRTAVRAPRIQPDLSVPENRHEHRDVNVFALGKFAIGLIIVTVFCVGLVAGVFQYLLHREGGIPASRMESPAQDARQLPPEPRLEETPARDLGEMREAESKMQNTYGWLDQSAGMVRLPIDRAMDLVVQRGLPARAEAGVQSAAAGVTVPTQSGLRPYHAAERWSARAPDSKRRHRAGGGQVACCATPFRQSLLQRWRFKPSPANPRRRSRPTACRTATSSLRFPAL